jgi:sulfate adenylyltransferase
MSKRVEPHGGSLSVLYLPAAAATEAKRESVDLPSWALTQRQLCDIKLLLNGGFSPLTGFLSESDYDHVVETMRLADGTLWPLPITLDVTAAAAEPLSVGDRLALRDHEGWLIAILSVESIWRPDKRREAELVYGSADEEHPGVDSLLNRTHPVYLGGRLEGVEKSGDHDFVQHRHDPAELRRVFDQRGWSRVIAYQTRTPMHRAHQELAARAAQRLEANLLIHPVVGMTQPGDIDHFSRVRCYEHVLKRFPEQTTMLSLLELAMRMAGPREALWHALIRKNYGCTHFIVGPDHASPEPDGVAKTFYAPYAAQELLRERAAEIGIEIYPVKELVYVPERGHYLAYDEVGRGETALSLSEAELHRRLRDGDELPPWFSFEEVLAELRRSYPPRHRQGFTVFFTGLSGAGKSTLAKALMVKLQELGGRSVTLLDGDRVRQHLSSELGFSKAHRDLNILRIGYVASEITKAGGIAICAPIAPYAAIRRQVRDLVEAAGCFVEIYVSTPLEVCEGRDPKGLYARARAGLIEHFTGIDDPYEAPGRAELEIDTQGQSPEEAAQRIVLKLENLGLIK